MKITGEIASFVQKQMLGFIASVNPDGTPNLSHKGTLTVYDDEHLIFADIHSPTTVRNVKENPAVEVNVVDIFTRKGYRFKGTGKVIPLSSGKEYIDFYTHWGMQDIETRVKNFVLISIDSYSLMYSPAYDRGATEEELKQKWKAYYGELKS